MNSTFKLDKFSDFFLHNKDRYQHPKMLLEYSPTNLIFIDPKARRTKRTKTRSRQFAKIMFIVYSCSGSRPQLPSKPKVNRFGIQK